MTGLAGALAKAIAADGRAVVAAIAAGSGSVPREAGAWMIVSASGQIGTIGGGHLEHEAARLAREANAGSTPAATWLVRFPLAARLGQCCGGVATVAFAVVDAEMPWLDLAGACERTSTACAIVHRLGEPAGAPHRVVVTSETARVRAVPDRPECPMRCAISVSVRWPSPAWPWWCAPAAVSCTCGSVRPWA